MSKAYVVVGIAALVIIIGAWYGSPKSFTDKGATIDSMNVTTSLSLTSLAFPDGTSIPSKYTCDEDRLLNPPLNISGVPEEAVSLALIMDDPDVPKEKVPSGVIDHWILFNIPPDTKDIPEGGSAGIAGANTRGANAYMGPCPPVEFMPNEHRYFFKLYALDTMLDLTEGASRADVEKAMEGHVIAETQLMGKYKKR
jgi:Raf kinase inhibitor-like YbhB/YbcL family protein